MNRFSGASARLSRQMSSGGGRGHQNRGRGKGTSGRGGWRGGGPRGGPKKSLSGPNPAGRDRKPIRVFTSNFDSFRSVCNNPLRFQVHRPKCSCPNVKHMLSDGSTILRMLDTADLGGEAAGEEEWFAEQLMDGLLVLPKTRATNAAYHCLDTSSKIFDAEPQETERKLAGELFPSLQNAQSNATTSEPFKVSCAACLLDDVPNGFACVSSTDPRHIEIVRDMAKGSAEIKEDNSSKHEDHAHFLATLSFDTLVKLHGSRTRSEKEAAQEEVTQLLSAQGVPVEMGHTEIKLQHHLSSLLWLLKERQEQRRAPLDEKESWYWLVLIYDDSSTSQGVSRLSLDIPGGKRNLGESTLDAAIRETEEEVSLSWNNDWVYKKIRGQQSEFMNMYFMICPPADHIAQRWDNQS